MVLLVNCRPSRSYQPGQPGVFGPGEMPSHEYEEVAKYSDLLIKPLTISRCKRCGEIWVKEDLSKGERKMITVEFDKGPPQPELSPEWAEQIKDLLNKSADELTKDAIEK